MSQSNNPQQRVEQSAKRRIAQFMKAQDEAAKKPETRYPHDWGATDPYSRNKRAKILKSGTISAFPGRRKKVGKENGAVFYANCKDAMCRRAVIAVVGEDGGVVLTGSATDSPCVY